MLDAPHSTTIAQGDPADGPADGPAAPAAAPAPVRLNTPKDVVDHYIRLREERAAMRQREEALTKSMERLQGILLQLMTKLGQDSFNTGTHTCYRSELSTVSVTDRSAFLDFVRNSGQTDLLDARASKEAIVNYVEVHQSLPPGVQMQRFTRVNVRKA